jgi:hypothetical protein
MTEPVILVTDGTGFYRFSCREAALGNDGRKMRATLSPPLTTQNRTQSLARGAASGGGTILLVTYHWPPDATVGAVRPVKLAKYLGQHGWRTVVLTVGSHYYEDIDPGVGNDSGEYVALRTRCLTRPSCVGILVS